MRLRWFSMLFLAVIGLAAPIQGWGAEMRDGSLVRHLPQGALGTIEVSNLAPLIERIENSEALKAYLNSPLYDQAMDTDPARKAMAGKAVLEAQLGTDLWTFAKTYLGDRMVLAVYPPAGAGQPEGVLVIRTRKADDFKKLLDRLTPLLAFAGDQVSISNHESGGKEIRAKDGNRMVLKDRWLVASKSPELLSQTLTNVTTDRDSGLESEVAWKLMGQNMGGQHTIQVCVNLSRITDLIGNRIIPEKLDNPVISLLYGGFVEAAARSPYAGMTLDVRENGIAIQSSIAGKAVDLDEAAQGTRRGSRSSAGPADASRRRSSGNDFIFAKFRQMV